MMAFQREPEQTRCDKCHDIILAPPKTSEGDEYCHHCGFVFGTSVAPSSWICDECNDVVLDQGIRCRAPWCGDCQKPMTCYHATASGVHGSGIDEELDMGLALLCEAQEADLKLGRDILRDSQN